MSIKNTTLIWFRNDLRIHDNQALFASLEFSNCVAIYIFNENDFIYDQDGFKKIGVFRYNFIIETLEDLKLKLSKLNVPLIILKGNTIELLKQKIIELNVSKLYFNASPGTQEMDLEALLTTFCASNKISFKMYQTNTLIHIEDLNFTPQNFPKIFTQFRKIVESKLYIRQEFPIPQKTNSTFFFNSFRDVNQPQKIVVQKINTEIDIKGGETNALNRLDYYLWKSNKINTYKETRNELIGMDYSTKFSAWLAIGAISPRRIFWEIEKYEKKINKNESTYWVIFELLWRDYFNLSMILFPKAYFRFKQNESSFLDEKQKNNFLNWKFGKTGSPFVDANMKELLNTGFMSNRGRQNVASYLINDLKLNWQLGAKHFEEYLVDYDCASNYGNWSYLAGKGNDPRSNRYFNIEKQKQTYDPQNKYINLWNK